jgi:hypothetical protein
MWKKICCWIEQIYVQIMSGLEKNKYSKPSKDIIDCVTELFYFFLVTYSSFYIPTCRVFPTSRTLNTLAF